MLTAAVMMSVQSDVLPDDLVSSSSVGLRIAFRNGFGVFVVSVCSAFPAKSARIVFFLNVSTKTLIIVSLGAGYVLVLSCHGAKQVHVDIECLRFCVFCVTEIFSNVVGEHVRCLWSSDL